jgi:phytanoyl-CoA hydroxylase
MFEWIFRKWPASAQADGGYHSRFGGLWIDRKDAAAECAKRRAAGRLTTDLAEKLEAFMRNGFIILPAAVDPSTIDRLVDLFDKGISEGDPRLRYHMDGAKEHVLTKGTDPRGKRLVEAHAVLPEARAPFLAPALIAFLQALFDARPVLTQSLLFGKGSEQGLHQDTAFVPYDQPMRFAAAWIALEDIKEGSGELLYVPYSHRLPGFAFANGRKDLHQASKEEQGRYFAWVTEEPATRGLEPKTFIANKGDIFVWHADLMHGGAPLVDPALTRKSLVGHFCPEDVYPLYRHRRARRHDGALLYSSYLVNLKNGRFYS